MSHIVSVILTYLSVMVMTGCLVVLFSHKESHMQKLALMVAITVLISSLGFLIKIESTSVEGLIIGQKLVYVSITHCMFLMLLFILEYCRFKIPKFIEYIFHGVNFFISIVVLTLYHNDWFYKSYWMDYEDGYPALFKEYGPVHTVAIAVFGIYMAAAIICVVIYSIKNYKKRTNSVWKLLIAVLIPCISYIVPKLTGNNNEMQPIAFAVFTVMVVYLIYSSKLYDVENIANQMLAKSTNEAVIILDGKNNYKGCNKKAEEFFPVLKNTKLDAKIEKAAPEIFDMVTGKTKEFHTGDCYFDVSIRQIIENGATTGRIIWMRDATLERNYTNLLKSQNKDLESEVDTLTDISLRDVLTGLFNRRSYDDRLGEIKAQNLSSKVVVSVLDLNGLKRINDTKGHSVGDQTLIATAKIINEAYAEIGNVFRTGGDEFSVIFTDRIETDDELEARIEKAMSTYNQNHGTDISIAYGFARAEADQDANIDELLINADKKMYENKRRYYRGLGN